jgi:hypothetical protein
LFGRAVVGPREGAETLTWVDGDGGRVGGGDGGDGAVELLVVVSLVGVVAVCGTGWFVEEDWQQ